MTTAHQGSARPTVRRPGIGAWRALVAAEAKMVRRDTAGMIIPIALPMLFLVMNGLGGTADIEIPGTDGRSAFDIFVIPLILAIVIATIGIINMPSFLVSYRRSGVLRRLSVTPASPLMILIAQAAVGVVQAASGVALALGVAVLAFDAQLPVHPGAALGVLALGLAAMYALGMVIASVSPTPNAALAIAFVVFFGLGALGGMFGSRENLPGFLADLGGVLPFGALVDALSAAWAGQPIGPAAVVSLVVTIVAGTAIAGAFFRWD